MAQILNILHSIFAREQSYTVNGVKYIVQAEFQPLTAPVETLNSRIARIIKNGIAHLPVYKESAILVDEYVYPTAGKENYAVEKEN